RGSKSTGTHATKRPAIRHAPNTSLREADMTEPRWFRDDESFGVHDDDGEVIARNLYRDVELADGTKQRVFPSIHVRPDHRHVGLAGRLTKYSLDITIDEGYRI